MIPSAPPHRRSWTRRLAAATRSARFRLTLSYALFSTLLLTSVGLLFHNSLATSLRDNTRDLLEQDWAALRGFLVIENGVPSWSFDSSDAEQNFFVSRLQRIILVTDARGHVLHCSEAYARTGIEPPDKIARILESYAPFSEVRPGTDGINYLFRSGPVPGSTKDRGPYYVSIGRSLRDNRSVVERFMKTYLVLVPIVVLGSWLLGWRLAGRALGPVTDVAHTAQRISGSNLSLRIPLRGTGDEMDLLISTFNQMIERLEVSFQQTKQFSADVSHELRTPLTALRGELEVALMTAQDARQYREAIQDALGDVERLSHLVRALLQLSNAETGQTVLQPTVFDLSACVRDTLEQFQIPAEEAGVSLEVHAPEPCPAELDRIQIERLISNLVANAIKYTPSGGRVTAIVRKDRPGAVGLVVEDTGIGIAREHLPHVFNRFYRAPGLAGAGPRGLGLGLSFVAWIVKAHGGTVRAESQPGKGARFIVSLPTGQPQGVPRPVAVSIRQES
ncbi:MAG: HAMP domain-containing protein [Bryobacterales bacterium]|nr:HAMP domain-containing protein [Bryobacterales bacterium]